METSRAAWPAVTLRSSGFRHRFEPRVDLGACLAHGMSVAGPSDIPIPCPATKVCRRCWPAPALLLAARPAIQLDPENSLQRAPVEGFLCRRCAPERALCHQLLEGHVAQREEQLGLRVEPRADSIEHGGNVLAE